MGHYSPSHTGGAGPARCWGGGTALSNHNATRKYWWSFRGIHVDPGERHKTSLGDPPAPQPTKQGRTHPKP